MIPEALFFLWYFGIFIFTAALSDDFLTPFGAFIVSLIWPIIAAWILIEVCWQMMEEN